LVAPLAAQSPPPLDKTELIRLLTNPLFAQTELADVVRRSCLTFHPTERDWSDLRSAGAGGEVIASAAVCDTRRTTSSAVNSAASEKPLPQPITAVAQPAEIVLTAGNAPTVRVRLSRGRTPIRRTTLALRGTTALGLPRDASAVTDDSGIAVFRLPTVSRVGSHQFEIRTGAGATLPGQPAVMLSVKSARPNRLRVTPDYVAFRGGDTTTTIVAAVTDSLGNPVSGEGVDMNGGIRAPLTGVTDSAGRATFTLMANSVSRGGSVQVRVRGLAAVDAARGMGMTEQEILTRVEIPIALPLIISGLRSATLQIVSTATVAAYVALGGLGRYVIDGLSLRDFPQMLTGECFSIPSARPVSTMCWITESIVSTTFNPSCGSTSCSRIGTTSRRCPSVSVTRPCSHISGIDRPLVPRALGAHRLADAGSHHADHVRRRSESQRQHREDEQLWAREDAAGVERRDFVLVEVETDHIVAKIGKTGARYQPHVSAADDGDLHFPFSSVATSELMRASTSSGCAARVTGRPMTR